MDEDCLLYTSYAYDRLKNILEVKNVLLKELYHKPALELDQLFAQLMEQRDAIRPYVGDTFRFLHDAVKADKNILLEGQLGALKDPDFGIYPMVTSSSTLAGYGAVGAGLPPYAIRDIVEMCIRDRLL